MTEPRERAPSCGCSSGLCLAGGVVAILKEISTPCPETEPAQALQARSDLPTTCPVNPGGWYTGFGLRHTARAVVIRLVHRLLPGSAGCGIGFHPRQLAVAPCDVSPISQYITSIISTELFNVLILLPDRAERCREASRGLNGLRPAAPPGRQHTRREPSDAPSAASSVPSASY